MIEITNGTIEERIIKLLQKVYPITITDVEKQLKLSRATVQRVLQKFLMKSIIQLEPLSDKTYIRLLRSDFSFIGKKRQKKFIKHQKGKIQKKPDDYVGIMFS